MASPTTGSAMESGTGSTTGSTTGSGPTTGPTTGATPGRPAESPESGRAVPDADASPSPTAGPRARRPGWQYARQPESEAALARLVAALRGGATRLALVGPAGSGKTLLLHVLPERLGFGFAHVYLPNPALGPGQIRAWLESADEPLPADAGTSLEDLAYAHARRGPGLVLLVDDGDAMPDDVADAYGAVLARTEDRLRIVLAGADEARLAVVLARLGGHTERVAIRRPAATPVSPAPGAPAALIEPAPAPLFEPSRPTPLFEPATRPAQSPVPPAPAAVAPLAMALTEPVPASATRHPTAPVPAASAPGLAQSAPRAPRTPDAGAPTPLLETLLTRRREPRLRLPPAPRGAALRAAAAVALACALGAIAWLARGPASEPRDDPDDLPAAEAQLASLADSASAARVATDAYGAVADPGVADAVPAEPDPAPEAVDLAPPEPVDVAPPEPALAAPPADAPEPTPASPATVAAAATVTTAPAVEPVLVHVNARPWAHIAVDGEPLGVTPLGNVPLAPGLRRIRAEMADGTVIEREVRIDEATRRVAFP